MYLPDSSITAIAKTSVAQASITKAISKTPKAETSIAETAVAESTVKASESPEAITEASETKTKSGFGVSLCLSLWVSYSVLSHQIIIGRPLAVTIAVTIAVLVTIAMSIAVSI